MQVSRSINVSVQYIYSILLNWVEVKGDNNKWLSRDQKRSLDRHEVWMTVVSSWSTRKYSTILEWQSAECIPPRRPNI